MNRIVKKLKSDIEIQKTVSKTNDKTVSNIKHHFEIIPNSNLISLTKFQRVNLIKALEVYFPDLYVEIEFLQNYNIDCETEVERFLEVLDREMSKDSHYNIYKDCKTPEYDFLRQLRLRFITK